MLLQDGSHLSLFSPTCELTQHSHHRQIGFAGAVVLDTLPDTDPGLPHRAQAGHKSVHQSCFANARLAADKAERTGTGAGRHVPFLQLGELLLPTNKVSGQLPVASYQLLNRSLQRLMTASCLLPTGYWILTTDYLRL